MQELFVRDPYTGETIEKLKLHSPEVLQRTLQRALEKFTTWRFSPAHERARVLEHVAAQLTARKSEFASLIRREAGKPITLAEIEVDRAISVLYWAAGEAQRFGGEILRLDAQTSGRPGFGMHTRFARGVVLGITPFNFPLNLVVHKIAPAVACGCPIVIKPSPYAPLTALKIASLFEEAQPGLVQVALADDAATAKLTQAREIATLSFTGSANVGWKIRKQAPEKPTTLELGGNAWVAVLDDADPSSLPATAKRIARGAFAYAGQSCISVQNVAVHKSRWKEMRELLAAETEALPFGDPSNRDVISGPVIHEQAAERIRATLKSQAVTIRSRQCLGAKREGAAVIAPTLVELGTDAGDSSLTQDELFGPALNLIAINSVDELVTRINSSRFGLQAGVYTNHWPTIERLYRELEVGGLVINDVPTTRFDHQPYGGVKESGQGREGVRYAMESMTESKFLAL